MSVATAPNIVPKHSAPPAGWVLARLRIEVPLGAAGLVILLSYVVVAAAHCNDRYQVSMVSGTCIALAQRLNDGVFYPALFDGERYGGTRYMPLSFVLHAGLARVTGEYLISGKLLTYVLSLILFAEVFVILRSWNCGRGVVLALTALVLLTPAGFLACTTIRGDLLPVVLQLAALMVACHDSGARRGALAAALCVLAVLAKATAVWAALAIACCHLAAGRWRAGLAFLATWIGAVACAVFLCNVASSGRMLACFAALAVPGGDAHSLLRAPLIFLAQLANGGLAVGLLIPAAAVGCVLAVRQRCVTAYHTALLFSVPLLAAICTDPGVDYNHLLDLVVLCVLVTGHLWSVLAVNVATSSGPRLGLAAALGWVLFAGWLTAMEPRLREIGYRPGGQPTHYPAVPLADHIAPGDTILTENAWIDVARGRTPVVLDSFGFARMTRASPSLADPLLRTIRQGGFDKIILRHRLDDATSERHKWASQFFGHAVVHAVEARYRLQAEAEGFFIYVRKK
jgi:hypothetical protein